MGQILTAICEKCGFERKGIRFGAARENYKTVCDIPAIDLNTNQLVIENYFNKENLGSNILFYTEQELFKGKAIINKGSWNWDNFLLKITENKCPECNNYSMKFESRGHFS